MDDNATIQRMNEELARKVNKEALANPDETLRKVEQFKKGAAPRM